MESKKINQLATEMTPTGSDLTIIGDPITGVSRKITLLQLSTTIGAGADLQGVTDNGATTTNPIAIGGLTITGLATGVLKSDSGVISSVPFGAANGVATLGGDGKVPSNQLPSYVDDVVEVANFASLPAIGETGKIYITLDNNKVYRWTGSTYVEIAANNAVWGAITGTLSNQTDLQNALNAKVPYTGATANVNLGTYTLLAAQIKATSSAGLSINANSGTQIADLGAGGGANMTLFGGLTGTSASFSSSVTGNTIVKSGGTSSQFLKADGSVDSSTYLTTSSASSTYVPYTGATTNVDLGNNTFASQNVYVNGNNTTNFGFLGFKQIGGSGSTGQSGYTSIYAVGQTDLYFNYNTGSSTYRKARFSSVLIGDNTEKLYYLPASDGTLALTSQLHDAVTIGTANGLSLSGQVLSLALSSTSTNGALSSTDWNTFNGKQAALSGTGFVKISGTTISYDNSTYLTTSAAASTYLPLTGGTLTGQLTINRASGTGLQVASDNVVITAATGFASPRQLVFTCGNGATTTLEAKGFGGNYITDFNIKTYNSSGTAFNVFFGDSAGNVGIGTDTPLSRLQVVATGTVLRLGEASGTTGKQLLFGVDGSTGRGEIQAVWQGTANTNLALNPAGGNVLIGTTGDNGTGKLQVINSQAGWGGQITNNNGQQVLFAHNGGFGLNVNAGSNASSSTYLAAFVSNGADRFYISGNGNVGIGTNSPLNITNFTSLQVNGVNSGLIMVSNNANIRGHLYVNSGGVQIGSSSNDLVSFNTNDIEKMRITSGGSVCVRRTSSPSSAYSMAIQEAIMMAVSTNGNNMVNFFNQGDGYVASIVVNNSTVIYGVGSDYRLKEDYKDFNGLEKLSAIKVYDFKYKIDGYRMEGVIAHELQEVVPYAVTGVKDEKNNDGTDKIQNVDYSKIVPILVKAIQEQQAQIEELKAKIK
jgi:hypothetical protein